MTTTGPIEKMLIDEPISFPLNDSSTNEQLYFVQESNTNELVAAQDQDFITQLPVTSMEDSVRNESVLNEQVDFIVQEENIVAP